MSRIGHYGVEIIAAILTWVVISLWIPMQFSLRISLSIVLVGAVLTAYVAMRKHNRGWCLSCVTPLDPNRAVERHARPMKAVHLSKDRPVIMYVYVMTGIAFTVGVLFVAATPVLLLWSAFQLTLIYVVRANVLHHRLQPWCPKCHGGDHKKIYFPTQNPVNA